MILQFDFSSDVPIYLQLRNQIVIGIGSGKLKQGDKLPTVRALAEESGINVMTVSKAYNLLKQEGYIITDRRKGAVIAMQASSPTIKDETIHKLRLCLSELRLAGMTKNDLHDLVEQLYEEVEA
jgi:DNA-binding transcriptional regulator YhcF (GntR family)